MQGCADVTIEYDHLDELNDKLFNRFMKEVSRQELCGTKEQPPFIKVQGQMTEAGPANLAEDFDSKV
jgi:hypothetical protein